VGFDIDEAPNANPHFVSFTVRTDHTGQHWHGKIHEVHYHDGAGMKAIGKPSAEKTVFPAPTTEFHLTFKLPRNSKYYAFDVDAVGASTKRGLVSFKAVHDPEVGNGPP
jgi:hypothetical protein